MINMSDFAMPIAPFFNELENHSVVSEIVGFAFSLFPSATYPCPLNSKKPCQSQLQTNSVHSLSGDEEHVNSAYPENCRQLKNTFCQTTQKSTRFGCCGVGCFRLQQQQPAAPVRPPPHEKQEDPAPEHTSPPAAEAVHHSQHDSRHTLFVHAIVEEEAAG